MNDVKFEEKSEFLYSTIFSQIQDSGDIISAILLIYKFITDNNISTQFNIDKFRAIALRATDKETSTYLWHINALIAAANDFEHLLLGIEIMFDRFLGNKHSFIKEKQKNANRSIMRTPLNSETNKARNKNTNPCIGNEIISFVETHTQNNENIDSHNIDYTIHTINSKLNDLDIESDNNSVESTHNLEYTNKPNLTANANAKVNDENVEYMNKYRGKISSPISFRMRKQKRLIQNERRSSQKSSKMTSRICSLDLGFENEDITNDRNERETSLVYEPEILSPFNVSKFAKIVDFEQ